MKVIPLHRNESALIRKAVLGDREAQRLIYERHASKMLSVCRYYIHDLQFAEDVMIKGFFKVFSSLGEFQSKGSFEGWVRRIMVRECIDYLRVQKNVFKVEEVDEESVEFEMYEDLYVDAEYIQRMIDNLPDGYRTVFLMYAIEGYSHKEISDLLSISESTSKSQLFKARKILKEGVNALKVKENGTA
ncbi:RNA polymerase subunit sigma-70 [Robertkochia solimangrovi]|nr:RNA polymerase subunit sigma-70 [Robertkochia solimangrovi]